VAGEPAASKVEAAWYKNDFIPTVAERGAAVIKARGASSAASAAAAAIDHMHDWILGTPDDDWVSMAVPSDGSYGLRTGIIYSYPVICKNGDYTIVPDLSISDFSRDRMQATETELFEERNAVAPLFPTG
jgi:malate dehydrogenase